MGLRAEEGIEPTGFTLETPWPPQHFPLALGLALASALLSLRPWVVSTASRFLPLISFPIEDLGGPCALSWRRGFHLLCL